MSKMPCSITDDPYNDYSDYIEGEGVYKQSDDSNEDSAYEQYRQEQIDTVHITWTDDKSAENVFDEIMRAVKKDE